MTPFRIALPKGRLFEPTIALFAAQGLGMRGEPGRRLLLPSENPQIEFLVVKPGDVPTYVESGAADIGVTGTDVLRETGADVLEPLRLGFGYCRLAVASHPETAYPHLDGGFTARVATKYPRLTRQHFASVGRAVEVVPISGSVEVAPLLGLAHWIVDLVDTGRTLRENGLVERETILACEATMVANRASQKLRLDTYLDIVSRLSRRSRLSP